MYLTLNLTTNLIDFFIFQFRLIFAYALVGAVTDLIEGISRLLRLIEDAELMIDRMVK